jgi:hypothetical protein
VKVPLRRRPFAWAERKLVVLCVREGGGEEGPGRNPGGV